MNTGQMLLVVGAFALLATSGLSVNRTLLSNDIVVAEAKTGSTAVHLAQGRVSEMTATPFDSLAVGTQVDTMATGYGAAVCSTEVCYVAFGAPDSMVAGPTGLKRVCVTVRSEGMPGRVTLRTVVGQY